MPRPQFRTQDCLIEFRLGGDLCFGVNRLLFYDLLPVLYGL
jgi:hypothetical protein